MNHYLRKLDDNFCEYCGSPYELVETAVPYALGYATMREISCSNDYCQAEETISCQECGDYQWQWQPSFFEVITRTNDTCPSCLQFYEDHSQTLDNPGGI